MSDFRRSYYLLNLIFIIITTIKVSKHLLIASITSSTSRKNKQISKRQLQLLLATLRNSKRVRKKYNTLARARYFETLSIKLERNKSVEEIDKKHKINIRIVLR